MIPFLVYAHSPAGPDFSTLLWADSVADAHRAADRKWGHWVVRLEPLCG